MGLPLSGFIIIKSLAISADCHAFSLNFPSITILSDVDWVCSVFFDQKKERYLAE